MLSFQSIKEFIDTFHREGRLLTELFDKRNLRVRYDDALLLTDEKEDRLELLINRTVLIRNGEFLEIESRYLDFFEDILDVNTEINTAFVFENIENIKANMNFYIDESNENRRYNYLRKIKSDIRKTGRTVIRNIIDLGRNIEDIYKTEPTYKIKISKLQRYETKGNDISSLIEKTHNLVFEQESLFFTSAMDEELKRIRNELRIQLNDGRNHLVEIQKQVIDYLNQIRRQSDFIKKLQRIKYLKDQFELISKTNVQSVIGELNPVSFEPNPIYGLKLSLEMLESDEALDIIKKVKAKIKHGKSLKLPSAPAFLPEHLEAEVDNEVIVDLEAVKNGFLAAGRDLFDFVMQYDFPKNLEFGEKVTIFCQLISLYPKEIELSDNYAETSDIEYVIAYPKQ
ncbi:MAG: hypothetical protein IPM51_17090 [Sphingobacteriaceae bacterium]|nr:hypothetical protein [Sphingobacteriaceae bacterium]